jgi:hypothetical protein
MFLFKQISNLAWNSGDDSKKKEPSPLLGKAVIEVSANLLLFNETNSQFEAIEKNVIAHIRNVSTQPEEFKCILLN